MTLFKDQFKVLLDDLTIRVDKALGKSDDIDCIGLLLDSENNIDVYTSTIGDSVSDAMKTLQNELVEKAKNKPIIASCMAYPSHGRGRIIALFENNEHYSTTLKIPVLTAPKSHLDVGNLEVGDGATYIFGD